MKLQKCFLIYLVINIVYIAPILFSWLPDPLVATTARYYVISMVFYYFFGTFIHIIFSAFVAVRSIRLYKNNKFKKTLCISLIITIMDILTNIAWAASGRMWTIH